MSITAILLAALVSPSFDGRAPNLPVVEVERLEGMDWWTVTARGVTVDHLLKLLARRSNRRLEGMPPQARAVIVNVILERRSLDQVLEYALGSVGLEYELFKDSIFVRPEDKKDPSRNDLIDSATAGWLRATTRFPGDPNAPAARLAQGELAEMRGLMTAANSHYQTLIGEYPASKAASEALMRSGRIYKNLGEWGPATTQFRELANRVHHAEYQGPSRLELARCLINNGSPDSARLLLDALEEDIPTTDIVVRTERKLVRAEIYTELHRYLEALRILDVSARKFDPIAGREVNRIRAIAMEGLQMYGRAGRAWLLYAQDAAGDVRSRSLENAARLALAAGDEMAVLFIYEGAKDEPLTPALVEYWKQARQRLGLDDEELQGTTSEERIVIGETHLLAGEFELAAVVFEPLYLGRGALPEILSARTTIGWARCVADKRDLEEAISLLGRSRKNYEDPEARKRLDLGAAKLLEENDRFDEAINAYQGNYGGSQ